MEEKNNNLPAAEQTIGEPPKKSKRDLLRERVSKKYPDKTFDTDDAYADQLYDDLEANDKEMEGYKQRESDLNSFMGTDPRSATFLFDWKEGKDPVVALLRHYGSEIVDAVNDPERQEEMAQANKEYLERVNKDKELEEQYKTNLQESLDNLAQAQEENGWTDEQTDAALEALIRIADDMIMGKFSTEAVKMMMDANNYDADIANAQQEGEVRGRNSKIEEKLRKAQSGDGTPHLDGKNGQVNRRPSEQSIFALAAQA